jgi:6-phosphogluconolactonase (cycloisomerase 2 family)
MHALIRIVVILSTLVLSIGAADGAASAAPPSDVVGQVYVNNNTAGVNTISGFNRHLDGALTPLSGSPFVAGGAGTGTITGSQGSLQISADRRYLLAADAGSNQISVLRIQNDGSLRPVETGPVTSGGVKPVSIAVHGSLVYVANNGPVGATYSGFMMNAGGRLTPILGSTVPLPDNALPGDVLFNGTGTNLVGMRVGPDAGPSYIDSFVVGSDGRLTAAPGSPFAAQRIGPFGSEFSPVNPALLFVSNAHDGPGNGTVSAYGVASNGVLTPVTGSPFADMQTAPCWVEVSHDGRYLFAVNTGSTTISRYSIGSNGALTLLGSTSFQGPSGLRPFDARLDPSGSYLYVVDAGRALVSAFAVNGGSLTELASSPFALPPGVTPFGIVVN